VHGECRNLRGIGVLIFAVIGVLIFRVLVFQSSGVRVVGP
jgi:hypothetical protein